MKELKNLAKSGVLGLLAKDTGMRDRMEQGHFGLLAQHLAMEHDRHGHHVDHAKYMHEMTKPKR
jgi:hypothetical protein